MIPDLNLLNLLWLAKELRDAGRIEESNRLLRTLFVSCIFTDLFMLALILATLR